MSDASAISELERAEHLAYAEGKGVKRVSLFNDGVQINAATEEKQDATIESVKTVPGLAIPEHNYISVAYPIATTEVFTYKTGGSGGTTVATVTIVYTDATKASISTVTKS